MYSTRNYTPCAFTLLFCFCFWFFWYWELNPGSHACQAHAVPLRSSSSQCVFIWTTIHELLAFSRLLSAGDTFRSWVEVSLIFRIQKVLITLKLWKEFESVILKDKITKWNSIRGWWLSEEIPEKYLRIWPFIILENGLKERTCLKSVIWHPKEWRFMHWTLQKQRDNLESYSGNRRNQVS